MPETFALLLVGMCGLIGLIPAGGDPVVVAGEVGDSFAATSVSLGPGWASRRAGRKGGAGGPVLIGCAGHPWRLPAPAAAPEQPAAA